LFILEPWDFVLSTFIIFLRTGGKRPGFIELCKDFYFFNFFMKFTFEPQQKNPNRQQKNPNRHQKFMAMSYP